MEIRQDAAQLLEVIARRYSQVLVGRRIAPSAIKVSVWTGVEASWPCQNASEGKLWSRKRHRRRMSADR
jgi:hypothetical protein